MGKGQGDEGVMVRADPEILKHWDIGQDDFGGPLIFHRHVAEDVPAYVIGAAEDRRVAQCSECMETLDFSATALEPAP